MYICAAMASLQGSALVLYFFTFFQMRILFLVVVFLFGQKKSALNRDLPR